MLLIVPESYPVAGCAISIEAKITWDLVQKARRRERKTVERLQDRSSNTEKPMSASYICHVPA